MALLAPLPMNPQLSPPLTVLLLRRLCFGFVFDSLIILTPVISLSEWTHRPVAAALCLPARCLLDRSSGAPAHAARPSQPAAFPPPAAADQEGKACLPDGSADWQDSDFILMLAAAAAEVPGFFVAIALVEGIGRRRCGGVPAGLQACIRPQHAKRATGPADCTPAACCRRRSRRTMGLLAGVTSAAFVLLACRAWGYAWLLVFVAFARAGMCGAYAVINIYTPEARAA